MRSDTISLAPGNYGAFAAGCSTGLVVAALKAFSASERESRIGPRAILFLYHAVTQKARAGCAPGPAPLIPAKAG